jgi:hypothetical protein
MTLTVSWWSHQGYHRREGLTFAEAGALVFDLRLNGFLPVTGVS